MNRTSTASIGWRPLQIARAFARAVRQRVGRDTLGVVFSISLVAAACVALVHLLRDVDIGKNPHRAVDAGVVSTPAVAIDGELVFRTSPAPTELRAAIEARLRKA